MTPTIILSAIVLIPIAILMVLRINAVLVFLSLCLGNVLVQFVAEDANSFMSVLQSYQPGQIPDAENNTIKLILLLLPVVLTAIFMIKTVKGSKLVINILPALGVGLLGSLLTVPLLGVGLSIDIMNTTLWVEASKAQNLIVGSSALICLFVLWLQRPKTGGDVKHGKHHK